jgi:VanZ family protein
MNKAKNLILYLVFSLCVIFLFAGKPGFYTARSSLYLWDLGHILLFTLSSLIIIKKIPNFSSRSFTGQLLIVFIFGLFFGILTELIQVEFDRTPDLKDLIRDILGALIGVAFFSPRRYLVSKYFRTIVQFGLLIMVLLEIYPFAKALVDETLAATQFPVLSDLETPLEIDRWLDHSQLQIENGLARNGKASLRVVLTTSKYSGVSLNYFPGDWEGYKYFNFSIFNPDSDTLKIVCRIHDKYHNHDYSDRFNRNYLLTHGWNDFSIPLAEIRSAPKNRKMDMSQIERIGIFTVRSPRKRIVYFDNFYLSI